LRLKDALALDMMTKQQASLMLINNDSDNADEDKGGNF